VAVGKVPLSCPFCGKKESERLVIEGHRMIVFACQFSPVVDMDIAEEKLQAYLKARYGGDKEYLSRQCNKLHMTMVVERSGVS
jgi:sarcosine oxidase delta subunit